MSCLCVTMLLFYLMTVSIDTVFWVGVFFSLVRVEGDLIKWIFSVESAITDPGNDTLK